ncbi:hypothetical protein TNIN_410181 [Trichonephila inaurata madagascariensis]|uniref:Uncharacterized protein n=1 Tax=Trichonephila inaurata madagascariensis TaxID=2747483 RepID=A0A8X6XBH9_9ARAC|nr:hypothetical protein TNIN_410181 [Trichonephila inaurata madagascariensis]
MIYGWLLPLLHSQRGDRNNPMNKGPIHYAHILRFWALSHLPIMDEFPFGIERSWEQKEELFCSERTTNFSAFIAYIKYGSSKTTFEEDAGIFTENSN